MRAPLSTPTPLMAMVPRRQPIGITPGLQASPQQQLGTAPPAPMMPPQPGTIPQGVPTMAAGGRSGMSPQPQQQTQTMMPQGLPTVTMGADGRPAGRSGTIDMATLLSILAGRSGTKAGQRGAAPTTGLGPAPGLQSLGAQAMAGNQIFQSNPHPPSPGQQALATMLAGQFGNGSQMQNLQGMQAPVLLAPPGAAQFRG